MSSGGIYGELVACIRDEFGIEVGRRPRLIDPEQVYLVARRLGQHGYRPLGKGRPGERLPIMPVLSEIYGLPPRSIQRILARKWPHKTGWRYRDRFRRTPDDADRSQGT